MFENEADFERIVSRLNIDNKPNPAHRESLRRQMLSVFNQTAQERTTPLGVFRRSIMKSPITKIAAAAAVILIALVIGIHRFGGPVKTTGVAFADVVRPILTARTVTCKINIDAAQGQASGTFECMFAEPGRMRQEMLGEYISIIDLQQGKLVILMLEEKKAMVMEMENISDEYKDRSKANMFFEVRRQIQQAQQSEDKSVEFLGEQEIDGQTAIGYHIQEPFFETTIWADAKTLLPVRIETSMPTVMDQQITAVFTDFAFDVELDDSLFSLKVPEEYAVETMQLDASRPQEEDLIEMLRLWAESTDGKFPSAFNMNAIKEFSEAWAKESSLEFGKHRERTQQLLEEFNNLSERLDEIQLPQEQLLQEYEKSSETEEKRRILKQWSEECKKTSKQEDELEQQLKQVLQQMEEESKKRLRQAEDLKKGLSEHLQEARNRMMPIVQGIMFVQELPDESDWHYTGKEAAFGDADAPIFWYRPEGSETYRLIYADLSVRDVTQDDLPKQTTETTQLVALDIKLPGAMFLGTPEDTRVPNLEKPLGKPRPPFLVPIGTKNVAFEKPVSSSDEEPIIGEIEMITDGDKEAADGSYVELGPFLQHVTIDLEAEHNIYAIVIWHFHKQPRVYFDVVVQVADDPDFITNVTTLFNNDIDNSAGFGLGKDMHYTETNEGKLIDAKGVRARYIRLYSNGNTGDDQNHYIEVEAYGTPAK